MISRKQYFPGQTYELRLGRRAQGLHRLTPLKIPPRRRGLESHAYLENCQHLFADGGRVGCLQRSDTTLQGRPHTQNQSANTWVCFDWGHKGGRERKKMNLDG